MPPSLPYVPHPPRLPLLLSEPSRAVATSWTLPLAWPVLARARRGDGHTVLALPGFLAGDLSTRALRTFLRSKGYRAVGWGLGRNVGPTPEILEGMVARLRWLAADGPVSIVGQSLGGVFARELARTHPSLVRQVITLGSPYALADLRQSRATNTFERRSRRHAFDRSLTAEDVRRPIPVPSTSVYSRADGIVHWTSCIEPPSATHDNVEVRCGHLGMSVDPATLWVVADRLAQPADGWQPFAVPRLARRYLPQHPYPTPAAAG